MGIKFRGGAALNVPWSRSRSPRSSHGTGVCVWVCVWVEALACTWLMLGTSFKRTQGNVPWSRSRSPRSSPGVCVWVWVWVEASACTWLMFGLCVGLCVGGFRSFGSCWAQAQGFGILCVSLYFLVVLLFTRAEFKRTHSVDPRMINSSLGVDNTDIKTLASTNSCSRCVCGYGASFLLRWYVGRVVKRHQLGRRLVGVRWDVQGVCVCIYT
jgi:hypothetical protein